MDNKQSNTTHQPGPCPSFQPPDHVRHLHQKALARRWNVSTRSLERWRIYGTGPAYIKLNGRVIYRLADIEAFEAARLRDSTNGAVSSVEHEPPPRTVASAEGGKV